MHPKRDGGSERPEGASQASEPTALPRLAGGILDQVFHGSHHWRFEKDRRIQL